MPEETEEVRTPMNQVNEPPPLNESNIYERIREMRDILSEQQRARLDRMEEMAERMNIITPNTPRFPPGPDGVYPLTGRDTSNISPVYGPVRESNNNIFSTEYWNNGFHLGPIEVPRAWINPAATSTYHDAKSYEEVIRTMENTIDRMVRETIELRRDVETLKRQVKDMTVDIIL